jgi:hypothetical protein
MNALLVMSFKPCPTRSRRSAECRRLTARACGRDLKSASPLPAWRQTMFEYIKRCSTAPEQAADPQTDSDAHRWRRLLPHGKQRRAGPRVGAFPAEDVSAVTSSVATADGRRPHALARHFPSGSIREAQGVFRWDTN